MTDKKRILLVSSAFYPEISPRSFRVTELAKEFYRQGHEVTVFSKFRDHDYTDFLKEIPITFKMWSKSQSLVIADFKREPFSYITRGSKRLLSLLFEYPGIKEMYKVKGMIKHESAEYDLMISFAVPYPVHWGVAWSRNEKHRIAGVWIADCGDPYMLARTDSFRKPFYFKYLETNFCQKCDYISVPFKEMSSQFYSLFLSKIRIIPQGFNFQEIRLYQGPINNQKPVFVFAGSIIPRIRDLTMFIDYISSIPTDFRFIVYTNQKHWFREFKKLLGEKLIIMDYIDRLSLVFEMSKADFLVNVDTIFDKENNTEAVPSKLIDYALAKRPILNINSSYLDKNLVVEFFNRNYSRQRIIELSNYDIKNVSLKFLSLIN